MSAILQTSRSSASWKEQLNREAVRRGIDLVSPRASLNQKLATPEPLENLVEYRLEPIRYIREKLGWEPWRGTGENQPGQQEIIDAYVLAIRQQLEKQEYESGRIDDGALAFWHPGQVIKNRIRVEAGHTVGKTKMMSGLVNHFFDCFAPSLIYTYAPNWEQIHDLLWKEIKSDRRDKGLPGRILDLALVVGDEHFAKGKATDNAQNRGTERAQGQHGRYQMFVLDEAEGVADFVFDATDSMVSGSEVSIILMSANPRTRTSRFYKQRTLSNVKSFRISCIHHPNVVTGRSEVPSAVKRDYVLSMVEQHCEAVGVHSDDDHTFTLPFAVEIDGKDKPSGTIFKPNAEFMFRVLGVAPANLSDNTFVPVGRYEAACKRVADGRDPQKARMGVDAAGYGNDNGTLFINHGGAVWREAVMSKNDSNQDPTDYWQKTRKAALKLKSQGVSSLHIRIDAGGGFGNGLYDRLKRDQELVEAFQDYKLFLVHFGGTPKDEKAYRNMATQMYAEAAESLKGFAVLNAPDALEGDLCEREYRWVNWEGREVRMLEEKEAFRKRQTPHRSPDDGDGFVLALAPDFIFGKRLIKSY